VQKESVETQYRRRRFQRAAEGTVVAGRAATGTVRDQFVERAQRYRPELRAHCYRLLGAFVDAEDAVQETYLRAWRSYDRFEARASERTWLYRIATNTCLSARAHASRRVLPSGLGAPSADPSAPPGRPDRETPWLQPFPGPPAGTEADDPATIVSSRDSLRLALIAALQYLPPRQRSVLLLREVMQFSADEVATMLDMSVPAVKSALQRARARIDQLRPTEDELAGPTDAEQRELLAGYISAFENSDAAALERLLRKDATLEAPPLRTWYAGIRHCMPYLATHVLGSPGHWRMLPTHANGQPAVAAYTRSSTGGYLPYGIVVLDSNRHGIERITAFGDPALVGAFGFPMRLT
jgi:RNA polymerase sigma-70 factor (ECF subfamily)